MSSVVSTSALFARRSEPPLLLLYIEFFVSVFAKLQSKKYLLGKLNKRRLQVQNINVHRPAKKVAPQRSPKGVQNLEIVLQLKQH